MTRHPGSLLWEGDLTKTQFLHLVHGASLLKAARADGTERARLTGKNIALVFENAGVPVWNGLTDAWHPTQMLADILTMAGAP